MAGDGARPREIGEVTRRPAAELRLRGVGRGAKELFGRRRRQAGVRGAVRNVCERLCAAPVRVIVRDRYGTPEAGTRTAYVQLS